MAVEINNDEVICPGCSHQFHAIPVNVQQKLRDVSENYTTAIAVGQGVITRIRELHQRSRTGISRCVECHQNWPCSTINAVNKMWKLGDPESHNKTGPNSW